MKIWILMFCLAPSVLWGQNLVDIPDSNLLKALKLKGYTTRDSLDTEKITRVSQLKLMGNAIQDLSGIEYFTRVRYLLIRDNEIKDLSHLPPNLRELDCSMNKLSSLDGLPSLLKYLNYSDNPIDPASLPEAYRQVNCDSKLQNCIPNSLIDWDILASNFDFTEMPKFSQIEINLDYSYSWGQGSMKETIVYKRRGEEFNTEAMIQHRKRDGIDTTITIPVNHGFNTDDLGRILLAIQNDSLSFQFQTSNGQQTIDLSNEYCKYWVIRPSCDDCNSYMLRFNFKTDSITYSCSYGFAFPIPSSLNLNRTRDDSFELIALINWLYAYQLVSIVLPENHEIRKRSFTEQLLDRVAKWNRT